VSESSKAAKYRDVRTFSAGAACGFLAGAFAVSLVVWQFGNVIGSREAGTAGPAKPETAVQRWGDGIDDAGTGVLERAEEPPASTIGRNTPGAPVEGSTASIGSSTADSSELSGRNLEVPVEGVAKDQLTRQFADKRGTTRDHEALDIVAPRNTPVRAVEDGAIARLFLSKAGGITIYQFDPSERYCYYYAHLERYAEGLKEGDRVKKGQVIGYVGTSGNAAPDTPHLHFAVFRLTAEKHWWEGTPIDPYDVLR
jgi:murein DD-endopeptidase MepM/ murein hydrolase activator NlpD